jgi:hypothetical protein
MPTQVLLDEPEVLGLKDEVTVVFGCFQQLVISSIECKSAVFSTTFSLLAFMPRRRFCFPN